MTGNHFSIYRNLSVLCLEYLAAPECRRCEIGYAAIRFLTLIILLHLLLRSIASKETLISVLPMLFLYSPINTNLVSILFIEIYFNLFSER